MSRIIVGYGNTLRGEDAFGVDVIKELEKVDLENTKLISTFQLTPELVLDLLDFDEIIFIDACYSPDNTYALACTVLKQNSTNLSHHISPDVVIAMLNNIYGKYPHFEIHSMLTNNFDEIIDKKIYKTTIEILITALNKKVRIEDFGDT